MATLLDCLHLSDFADYDKRTPLTYSHQHLKAKINSDGDDILVNSSFIPTKYFDIIRKNIEIVNLTDAEFLNYKYQPKKFCYDRYGTTELWGILLRLNSMTSLSDFASQSFRAPKANILILLNEMLILEKRNIEKNNESIG